MAIQDDIDKIDDYLKGQEPYSINVYIHSNKEDSTASILQMDSENATMAQFLAKLAVFTAPCKVGDIIFVRKLAVAGYCREITQEKNTYYVRIGKSIDDSTATKCSCSPNDIIVLVPADDD